MQKSDEESHNHVNCVPSGSPVFLFNVNAKANNGNNQHTHIYKSGHFFVENRSFNEGLENSHLHKVENDIDNVDDEVGFFGPESETTEQKFLHFIKIN